MARIICRKSGCWNKVCIAFLYEISRSKFCFQLAMSFPPIALELWKVISLSKNIRRLIFSCYIRNMKSNFWEKHHKMLLIPCTARLSISIYSQERGSSTLNNPKVIQHNTFDRENLKKSYLISLSWSLGYSRIKKQLLLKSFFFASSKMQNFCSTAKSDCWFYTCIIFYSLGTLQSCVYKDR